MNCKTPAPVSIIICAKNEAENLKANLPIIFNQDYPEFEIILVDDASSDNSLSIMESFKKNNDSINIRVSILAIASRDSKGKKNAITKGVLQSKHDILLFTDADCTPISKHWIKEMASRFSLKTDIVLGYGAYRKKRGSFLNKLIRFETLLTAIQYFSYAISGKAYMGVGRNLAYRKQNFMLIDGFKDHEHILSGDDDLLVSQMTNPTNTNVCDTYPAFTYSNPEKSFAEWLSQKKRHLSTSGQYKTIHKLLLGLFYVSQFGFYFLALIAIWFNLHLHIILPLIIIRFTFWYTIIIKSSSRLNEKDLICFGPLYEISIIFIQLYIFFSNLISPKKNW